LFSSNSFHACNHMLFVNVVLEIIVIRSRCVCSDNTKIWIQLNLINPRQIQNCVDGTPN
jgi:hypothetical protein